MESIKLRLDKKMARVPKKPIEQSPLNRAADSNPHNDEASGSSTMYADSMYQNSYILRTMIEKKNKIHELALKYQDESAHSESANPDAVLSEGKDYDILENERESHANYMTNEQHWYKLVGHNGKAATDKMRKMFDMYR